MIQLSKEQILLDNKINANIEWYYDLIRSKNKTKIETQEELNTFQNLIAKLAIWYELIHPDRMIKEAIIRDNDSAIERYNLGLDKEDVRINYDDIANFYNKDVFISSLSIKEKKLLKPFVYQPIIEISIANGRALLLLDNDGYILSSINLDEISLFQDISLKELLMNEHIKDVIKFLKDNNWPVTGDLQTLDNEIEEHEAIYQKLIESVIYYILIRGQMIVGPRRAFQFAKEFHGNIDLPLIYGINYFDPRLREFINDYLIAGGHKDLVCYENFFTSNFQYQEVTIEYLLRNIRHTIRDKYTLKEVEVVQKLVKGLSKIKK